MTGKRFGLQKALCVCLGILVFSGCTDSSSSTAGTVQPSSSSTAMQTISSSSEGELWVMENDTIASRLQYCRPGEGGHMITHADLNYGFEAPADLHYVSENGTISFKKDGSWKAVKPGEDCITRLQDWDLEEMKERGLDPDIALQLPKTDRFHVYVTEDYPVYTLRNPKTEEYRLVDDRAACTALVDQGWEQAEEMFVMSADSGTKVRAFYNPEDGDRMYTVDSEEAYRLREKGWTEEASQMTSDTEEGIPVYCLTAEINGKSRHLYTTKYHDWRAYGDLWKVDDDIALYAVRTPLYDDGTLY